MEEKDCKDFLSCMENIIIPLIKSMIEKELAYQTKLVNDIQKLKTPSFWGRLFGSINYKTVELLEMFQAESKSNLNIYNAKLKHYESYLKQYKS